MLPEVSQSKKVSRFFWAATLFLIVAAIVIPRVDFSIQQDSLRAEAATAPFAPEVHELDQQYREEGLEAVDPDRALDYAPYLKARALTDAGPVSEHEVVVTAEHIEEFQPEIADQPGAGSRAALRNHRNELIADELTRLEEPEVVEVLDEVRGDYIEAFDVDPSYVSEFSVD